MIRALGLALTCLTLIACGDGHPAHYYVFCEDRDYNGWTLANVEEQDGYIMACTYQSQDRTQSYTSRCYDHGCD